MLSELTQRGPTGNTGLFIYVTNAITTVNMYLFHFCHCYFVYPFCGFVGKAFYGIFQANKTRLEICN